MKLLFLTLLISDYSKSYANLRSPILFNTIHYELLLYSTPFLYSIFSTSCQFILFCEFLTCFNPTALLVSIYVSNWIISLTPFCLSSQSKLCFSVSLVSFLVRFFLPANHLNWMSYFFSYCFCSVNFYTHIIASTDSFKPSHSAGCFHVSSKHARGPISQWSISIGLTSLSMNFYVSLLSQIILRCFCLAPLQ